MKEIMLTKGKIAIVDDADYEWLRQRSWYYSEPGGYAEARINGQLVGMHRYIMYAIKGQQIDHKNRNKLDNQKSNLRFSTQTQNLYNKRVQNNNKVGLKGVFWCAYHKRWRARIRAEGKTIHLGSYDNPIDAAHAYDTAARKYAGEFAWLNFPDQQQIEQ